MRIRSIALAPWVVAELWTMVNMSRGRHFRCINSLANLHVLQHDPASSVIP